MATPTSQSQGNGDLMETEEHDLVAQVLSNHLILPIIFGHLPPSSLKSARLVSRAWLSFATPALGAATAVYPLSLGFHPIPSVLMTNVHLQMEGGENPVNFLSTHHGTIRTLCFTSKTSPVVKTLFEVLRDLEFGSISKIKVRLSDFCLSQVPALTESFSFRVRPSLTSISITIQKERAVVNESLQNLLNSCPNLGRLSVKGPFFPDLSGCQSLRRLSLKDKIADEDSPRFRLVRINPIMGLAPVRSEPFPFPSLPGVKLLKLAVSYSPWSALTAKIFPNLVHLELVGLEIEHVARFRSGNVCNTVTSLTIVDGTFDPESAAGLVSKFDVIFPNVTCFESKFVSDNAGTDATLEAMLRSSLWKLEKVVVHVRRLSWYQVLGCLLLRNVHGAGWKKFHLINGDEFVRMEDFGMDADHVKKFKELILPSKGMKEGLVFDKTFRDFNGTSSAWNEIHSFISKNGLLIKFY